MELFAEQDSKTTRFPSGFKNPTNIRFAGACIQHTHIHIGVRCNDCNDLEHKIAQIVDFHFSQGHNAFFNVGHELFALILARLLKTRHLLYDYDLHLKFILIVTP